MTLPVLTAKLFNGVFKLLYRFWGWLANTIARANRVLYVVDESLGDVVNHGIVNNINKSISWLVGILLGLNVALLHYLGAPKTRKEKSR